jgi:uncharacterized protein with LGFP repeats
MPKEEPSGEVPGVSVSGSQGIQIGEDNTQYIVSMPKPPLDPAALGGLNPHTALARLRQLTHDELVDFFARAKPEDVSEILGVFAEVDLRRLKATLGDINRRKTSALIDAVDPDDYHAGLDELPGAAEAINRRAATLGWADAQPLESFPGGYTRKYKDGHIFWSADFGTRTTVGAIDDYISDRGYEIAPGFPAGDQEIAAPSPFGTEGIRQDFSRGMVYSSKHGVFCVQDESCFKDEGESSGWLGFPITASIENYDGGFQRFEGGAIFFYIAARRLNAFAVHREAAGVLPDDLMWHPVSKEAAVESSSGKKGTVQRFEVQTESGAYETAVYWGEGNKPVTVAREFWNYYTKLGAEKSWLGFPESPGLGHEHLGVTIQGFDGGAIYWYSESGPIAVRKAVFEFIAQAGNMSMAQRRAKLLPVRLGFPVTEEASVSLGESDRIQYFENGVVTCRNGKYEVWLRPDTEPVAPVSALEPPSWTLTHDQ